MSAVPDGAAGLPRRSFLTAVAGDGWWRQSAVCAQIEPELWFSEYPGPIATAKGVCVTLCPVRAHCLAAALLDPPDHGVNGGLSNEEIAALAAAPTRVVKGAVLAALDATPAPRPLAEELRRLYGDTPDTGEEDAA